MAEEGDGGSLREGDQERGCVTYGMTCGMSRIGGGVLVAHALHGATISMHVSCFWRMHFTHVSHAQPSSSLWAHPHPTSCLSTLLPCVSESTYSLTPTPLPLPLPFHALTATPCSYLGDAQLLPAGASRSDGGRSRGMRGPWYRTWWITLCSPTVLLTCGRISTV